tara:strand:- start:6749 stop:7363 length:615 start_codon:yes stop_codon:yes gene_type:complete
MNTKEMIEEMKENDVHKHMSEHGEEQADSFWQVDTAPTNTTDEFRVKITAMADDGKLHMQFGSADVAGLHARMKKELRSPFVYLSGKMLRPYGLAFDLTLKNGSIDSHQLKELGHKVREGGVSVKSLAQADDYCMMEFIGVEDGDDNTGEPCRMLVFELAPKCRLYIKFTDIPAIVPDNTKTLPEYRAEWVLGWLCANYLLEDE